MGLKVPCSLFKGFAEGPEDAELGVANLGIFVNKPICGLRDAYWLFFSLWRLIGQGV
jgi:hypothetical protein